MAAADNSYFYLSLTEIYYPEVPNVEISVYLAQN
jgi:hypothetical protein